MSDAFVLGLAMQIAFPRLDLQYCWELLDRMLAATATQCACDGGAPAFMVPGTGSGDEFIIAAASGELDACLVGVAEREAEFMMFEFLGMPGAPIVPKVDGSRLVFSRSAIIHALVGGSPGCVRDHIIDAVTALGFSVDHSSVTLAPSPSVGLLISASTGETRFEPRDGERWTEAVTRLSTAYMETVLPGWATDVMTISTSSTSMYPEPGV